MAERRGPFKRARGEELPGDGGGVATAEVSKPRATPKTEPLPDAPFAILAGGRRLGELLVEANAIQRTQLVEALAQQAATGMRIGQLLGEMGLVNERSLVEALGAQSGLPVMDLKAADPRADAVGAIPEALARSLGAVPLAYDNDRLIVAAAEPLNKTQQAELAQAAKAPVTVVLAPASEVRHL